jgi:TonB family protein
MPKVRSQHVCTERFRAARAADRTLRKEISMFETSVVQARAKAAARRPVLFSLSIGAHAAAVVGVVAMSVFSVSLPKNAPNQFSVPIFTMPVVLPPRLGNPETKKPGPATPPQAKHAVAPPSATAAPSTIPDKVAAVPSTASTMTDVGPLTNNVGDSPGPGDPNGTKDGVKDGVLTDTPPVVKEPPTVHLAKQPVVIHRVIPQYPMLMQKMRMNGFVILDCTIDPSGHVREAHVVGSSNSAFEQSALDAVYQWQFAPGTMNGVPVNGEFELKVTFEIH